MVPVVRGQLGFRRPVSINAALEGARAVVLVREGRGLGRTGRLYRERQEDGDEAHSYN